MLNVRIILIISKLSEAELKKLKPKEA